jgi:hypothetical protein
MDAASHGNVVSSAAILRRGNDQQRQERRAVTAGFRTFFTRARRDHTRPDPESHDRAGAQEQEKRESRNTEPAPRRQPALTRTAAVIRPAGRFVPGRRRGTRCRLPAAPPREPQRRQADSATETEPGGTTTVAAERTHQQERTRRQPERERTVLRRKRERTGVTVRDRERPPRRAPTPAHGRCRSEASGSIRQTRPSPPVRSRSADDNNAA